MLVFIDESGDTGFKTGSSRFFTITMVVFRDVKVGGQSDNAEHASSVVRQLRTRYHINPEYHFTDTSNTNRERFYKGMAECTFGVYAVVADKEKITSKHLRSKPKQFYNYMLKQLVTCNNLSNVNIKLDGQRNKKLADAMRTYLRRDNPGLISKFETANSRNNHLIQLADMVCGAIHYQFNRSSELNADRWRKMLGNKVKNVWNFTGKSS